MFKAQPPNVSEIHADVNKAGPAALLLFCVCYFFVFELISLFSKPKRNDSTFGMRPKGQGKASLEIVAGRMGLDVRV